MSNLSWHGLLFLLEKTDFTEGWMGFGFATSIKDALLKEAEDKATKDEVMKGVLSELKKRKGWL